MSFTPSNDVYTQMQQANSRSTRAVQLDAQIDQPDLRTFMTAPGQPSLVQYPIEVATALAAAYWRFEEASGPVAAEAIDGLDGAYGGGIGYRATGALAVNQGIDVNYAVTFNGSSAEVVIPHDASINFGATDASVEFWIKTTQASLAHVLGKYAAGSYPFAFVLLANGRLRFDRYNGSTTTSVTSTNPINDGAWHYVVGQFDPGTEMLLQIDAAAQTVADPGGTTNNTADLVVGHRAGADWFAGTLDELALYPYALTVALRQRHRDAGLGVPV